MTGRAHAVPVRSSAGGLALTLLAGLAIATPARPAAAQDREVIAPRSPADGSDVLPFSGAVRVGETLYLSGTIGREADGSIPETAEREATLVLNNVRATLEAAGMTMDDLVYVQVFSSDVSDYDAFNSVYRTYFTSEFPARAYLGSGTLLFGARFEVQSIAVRR
jgi:2-iminobutanoate/2-iminopropanoate deaminase